MPLGNDSSDGAWSNYDLGTNAGSFGVGDMENGGSAYQQPAFDLNSDWLSGIGYNGSGYDSMSQGNDNTAGTSQTSDDLKDWLKNKNYQLQLGTQGSSDLGTLYNGRVVNGSGNQVGGTRSWQGDNDSTFGLAIMAAAGAFGAPMALGAAGAGLGASAATGAGLNAGATFGSGGSTGDILKAAASGGAGGYVAGGVSGMNPGGYVTDSALGQSIINKGITGGINAGLKGGNITQGAAMGGVSAGANGMWDSFMNTIGGGGTSAPDPYSGGGYSEAPKQPGPLDSMMGYSSAPPQYQQPGVLDRMGMGMGSFSPTSYNGGGGGSSKDGMYGDEINAMGLGSQMGSGAQSLPSFSDTGGAPAWQDYLKKNGGNLIGGLASLYMGQRQASQLGNARSQLDQLYSPNSPYAQQMRQNIMRSDAASGRRSQVGARETTLASNLTGMRSGQLMSPQYQALINGQTNAQYSSLGPLLSMYNRGTFNGLPGAVSSGYDALSNAFGN